MSKYGNTPGNHGQKTRARCISVKNGISGAMLRLTSWFLRFADGTCMANDPNRTRIRNLQAVRAT